MQDHNQPYKDRIRAALEACQERQAIKNAPKSPRAKRFTTDYAIKWGKRKGWTLMDRERYDYRTKRHHDLPLGADAMFETDDGIVYVQGAGKSERAAHWRRFEEQGGVERARKLGVAFYYVEFMRGDTTPITEEQWA